MGIHCKKWFSIGRHELSVNSDDGDGWISWISTFSRTVNVSWFSALSVLSYRMLIMTDFVLLVNIYKEAASYFSCYTWFKLQINICNTLTDVEALWETFRALVEKFTTQLTNPPGSPHLAHITSSQSPPSLSSPITASTFHYRLKTHLFHKSFPP